MLFTGIFAGIVGGVVEAGGGGEGVGEVLLGNVVAGVVVRVFVVGSVAHFFHQRRRRVAQVERHGEVAALAHFGQGCVYGKVGGI